MGVPFSALKALSLYNLMFYKFWDRTLSHIDVDSGNIIKNKKYRVVKDWPIVMNGSSTGRPPIQVKINQDAVRVQNRI